MTDPIVPPGSPGILPRWTSSAKSAVGTAAGAESRIWFTISHGILNEVYAPRLDIACLRDFGLIITAKDYFSEEKRDTDHTVALIEDGIPAFRLVNTSRDGRYRITKLVFSDPDREVILQEIHFEALTGKLSDYQVHAIIAPTLSTRVLETRPGAVTSRDVRCCLRKHGVPRSQSSPRRHGLRDLSAMSARPMVGRHYPVAKA
jgi:glucoamylase